MDGGCRRGQTHSCAYKGARVRARIRTRLVTVVVVILVVILCGLPSSSAVIVGGGFVDDADTSTTLHS